MKHLKRFGIGIVAVGLMLGMAGIAVWGVNWLVLWQYSPLMFKCIFGAAFIYVIGGLLQSAWPIMRGRK